MFCLLFASVRHGGGRCRQLWALTCWRERYPHMHPCLWAAANVPKGYLWLTAEMGIPKHGRTRTSYQQLGPPSSWERGQAAILRPWSTQQPGRVISPPAFVHSPLPLSGHHIPSPIWFTEAKAGTLPCRTRYIISPELIWAKRCKFLSYPAPW